jgi:3-oxoacyl-[acyl-carrier protein] reductase
MASPVSSRELEGRVAVVTGAGRNIGRAIALSLAQGGAAVVVNARTSRAETEAVAAEIEAAGGKALACLADVTDEAAVARMADAARKRFGRVDIVVSNAAVRRETDLESITLADWREIIGVILDGAFILAKAFLTDLKSSGAGALINIGGMTAHTGGKRRPHVIAAKNGLVGLTKALANDLAEHRVTVNCVVPGLIDTVRVAGSSVMPAHHTSSRTLVGRLGQPDDIAAAVRYLAGPGARYVTGQTIHVNGGAYLG